MTIQELVKGINGYRYMAGGGAGMMKSWQEICSDISEQCTAEGYPSHGSNYELRVEQEREQFEEQGFLLSDEEVERWNRKE